MNLIDFTQLLIASICAGSIYGLVAISFNFFYNTTGVINFSQGDWLMFGALTTIAFRSEGFSIVLSLTASMSIILLLSLIIYRLMIAPIIGRRVLSQITMTIGIGLLLKALALLLWGRDIYSLQSFWPQDILNIGLINVLSQQVLILIFTVVVAVGLSFFLNRSIIGKSFIAISQSLLGAKVTGIYINKFIALSFVISTLMAAFSGSLIAPIALAHYQMGTILGIKGFTAMIIGGIGNYEGALIAGFFIGLSEGLFSVFMPSQYKETLTFLLLFFFLLWKPQGIFER